MLTQENTFYYGLPAQAMHNDHLRIVYMTACGPRLVGLYLAGDDRNFLAETPDLGFDTPHGYYALRGGHRLWVSPERFPETYFPDNDPPLVEALPRGVRLTAPVQSLTGLQKSIEIVLDPRRALLRLVHRITNLSARPVQLSAWGITQLPNGGVVILPQQSQNLDEHGLLPNRNLVLWPYTRMDDPRLQLQSDPWIIQAAGQDQKLKIGYLNLSGWAAYLHQGRVFCKTFTPQPGAPQPDMGCNLEVYSDHNFTELETIGPLTTLQPAEAVEHQERWQCFATPDEPGMNPALHRACRSAI